MRLTNQFAFITGMLAALSPTASMADTGDSVVTNQPNVTVRAKPSKTADVVTTVNPGDKMIEVEYRNDWYLVVVLDQHRRGWVYGPLLEPSTEITRTAQNAQPSAPSAQDVSDAPGYRYYTTAVAYDPDRDGDPERGEKIFFKCGACHTTVPDIHGEGPSLVGVFGNAPAKARGYRYSGAMQTFSREGAVWDEAMLDRFIQRPERVVKGTSMPYSGIRNPQDRRDVIAYLKRLSG